jgi:hypothetical protein
MTTPLDPSLDPMGEPAGGLGTLVDEETRIVPTDEGDHERFAHYVRKEKIVESAVMGIPVIALCGKVWVPNRDPQRFPVCPECKEIYDSLKPGGDGGGSGGDS